MFECLILGDSIAKGSADALRSAVLDRCAVVAKVGASTDWAARMSPAGRYRTATISSGSNDAAVPGLRDRLVRLRRAVSADRVMWILPYDPVAARTVTDVALENGDRWISLADISGARDHLHPANYKPLAATLLASGYAGMKVLPSPATASVTFTPSMPIEHPVSRRSGVRQAVLQGFLRR